MILNFKRLQHLVAIAEEANFSRAAEKLGITQPALSRSIAQMEEACGLRLFDRSRSGVALTSAGTDLLGDARQLLGQVGAIEQNLLLQSRGEAGRIDFGIGPLAANYLMTDLLAESLAEHPSLLINATVGSTGDLIAGVLDGGFDFVIVSASTISPHASLAVRPLGQFRTGYFVRSEHPLARREQPIRLADLASYPRATGKAPPPNPSSREQSLFRPLGATVACDDFEVLRRLTLRSDTIWLTSDRLLARELASGTMCEIHPEDAAPMPTADIVMVTVPGRTQSPAVRHVVETAIRLMRA
ncbi:MAG: LysR family transcriptional regulator [Sphingomonadaceae bacterium]|nr:LysR family transcriptional regulator [Sphingomonadaceae bacterium]